MSKCFSLVDETEGQGPGQVPMKRLGSAACGGQGECIGDRRMKEELGQKRTVFDIVFDIVLSLKCPYLSMKTV